MYKESDLVAVLKDIPKEGIHLGDVGTIAFVYEDSNTLYEVEFMNAAGETLAVLTLSESELRPVSLKDVRLHLNDAA